MIELRFSVTKPEFEDASRNSQPWLVWWRRFLNIVMLLCAIPVLGIAYLKRNDPSELWSLGWPYLLFLAITGYRWYAPRRAWRRRHAQFQELHWVFGDEQISLVTPNEESTFGWDTYSRVTETPTCILLWYRHTRVFHLIPKRVLEERSLLEEFRALVKARVKP